MGNSNTILNKQKISGLEKITPSVQLHEDRLDRKLTCILCNETLSYLKTDHCCSIRLGFSEFTIKRNTSNLKY